MEVICYGAMSPGTGGGIGEGSGGGGSLVKNVRDCGSSGGEEWGEGRVRGWGWLEFWRIGFGILELKGFLIAKSDLCIFLFLSNK